MRTKMMAGWVLAAFVLGGFSLVAGGEDSNAPAAVAAAPAGASDTNAAAPAAAAALAPAPMKSAGEIFDFSTAKLASYKTWSGDVTQEMSMFGRDIVTTGTIVQKQPRRMRVVMDVPMGGKRMKMNMVLGSDGIMWQEMSSAGQTQVVKMDMVKVLSNVAAQTGMKLDPLKAMDPSQQWAMNKEMMDFTFKGVQSLHDQPMYVLEGNWKDAALTNRAMAAMAAYLGRSVVYVGQDDGFVHKFEEFAATGTNRVMSMELSNLKFNQDVSDDVFKYQPPPDAQVRDMTAAAGAPGEEAPAQASPVPQPATPAPVPTP